MAPKIVNKESKRLEIATAACLLFSKYGFEKVKIEDVAQAAGIGKGTVYAYFDTKEELFQGAFEALLKQMMAEMMGAIDLTLTPLEALRSSTFMMAEGFVHFSEQYGFFLEFMLQMNRGQVQSSLLVEMLQQYRNEVAGLLEAAIDAGEVRADIDIKNTAAAYAAWFDGAVFHWMVLEVPEVKAMVEAFWQFFCDGVGNKKAK